MARRASPLGPLDGPGRPRGKQIISSAGTGQCGGGGGHARCPRRAGRHPGGAGQVTSPAPLDSLTQAVGNTPMVRLRSLEPPGVEIHAKLEWFNPGGSVKDRAALRIIQEALPGLGGRTLIDSTSGNTGIAYSWIGAALRIPIALVMPGNVSEARKRITRHFGAQIIYSDPQELSDGAIRLAQKLVAEEPRKWF